MPNGFESDDNTHDYGRKDLDRRRHRAGDKALNVTIPIELYDALDNFAFHCRPKRTKRDTVIEALRDLLQKYRR